MIRFGTDVELYRLTANMRPQQVPIESVNPFMLGEWAASQAPSRTKRPILVNKYTWQIIDGNHRYWEAMRRGDRKIAVYLISGKVDEYRDDRGRYKVRLVD